MTPEQAFGHVLRELRQRQGISQERLAQESGLDRTFISLLERGLRQPSLGTILQVARALDAPPDAMVRAVHSLVADPGGPCEAP
jgi:transcriptional regulator with XRE-family HTH domain